MTFFGEVEGGDLAAQVASGFSINWKIFLVEIGTTKMAIGEEGLKADKPKKPKSN